MKSALLLAALSCSLFAQESELPLALNLPTTDSLQAWDIGVRFTHRFTQQARGNSRDFYGLDSTAFAGFGFDFGIKPIRGLNAQVYRTADRKTLVLALQQRLVEAQSFQLSVRAERFDETIQGGRLGGAFQVPVDWAPHEALVFSAVPTWLTRTDRQRDGVFNIGGGIRWSFAENQRLYAEIYPRPRKVGGSFEEGYALGYAYRTPGHRFSFMASNVLGTTTHQVLGGDYAGGPRRPGNWSLGFNLVRLF